MNESLGSTKGVYLITTPTEKCYVGMTTVNFKERWALHLKKLRSGTHPTPALQRAFNRYSDEGLTFTVLQAWPASSSVEEATILTAEREWWIKLSSEGKVMLHGQPSGAGSVIHTEESKAKTSASVKARFEASSTLSESEVASLRAFLRSSRSWSEVKQLTGFDRRKLLRYGFDREELDSLPFLKLGNRVSKEELKNLYCEDKLTTRAIAQRFNTSHFAVEKLLKQYGIPARRKSK